VMLGLRSLSFHWPSLQDGMNPQGLPPASFLTHGSLTSNSDPFHGKGCIR
jgi:hypothetical protein